MRVFLHTFGCKANQYDTERVREAVEQAGARIVRDPAQADAAVINSCTVTHVAEAKMRGLVRRIARRRPGVRTVVMGCAAARDDGSIAALPGVAEVVGGGDAAAVLRALGMPAGAGPLRRFGREGRAWLRIQDGCDEHCTFCATTRARGANRSRPADELVDEAAELARYHGEIVLTGVHIGSWGAEGRGTSDLSRLLERLVSGVPGVRFRLSSIEATEVDQRLADLMTGAPDRLAPHLHAPLQSGSNRVLRRMGRHWYTAQTYRTRVEQLAARLPVFGLGADVMVGFPGETESDHRATVSLVEDLPFTYLHVFPYSARPGTAAGRLGPPLAAPEADRRAAELRALAERKGAAYRAGREGQAADVVLSGRSRGVQQGMTEDYLPVEMPADAVPAGRFRGTLRTAGGRLTVVPRTGREAVA